MIGEAFELGRVVATPGALNLCEEANVSPSSLIARHASGDWGDLDAHDRHANDQALKTGTRIFSAYPLGSEAGVQKIWIITEANRSSICLLTPEEYWMTLPKLQMGSYLAFEDLPTEIRGDLVPVRLERMEPVVELSYEPIPCEALMPEGWHYGEWPRLSVSYREMLDRLGVERIAAELNVISERRGGMGLMLLDHDSPVRGDHGQGHGDTTTRSTWSLSTG